MDKDRIISDLMDKVDRLTKQVEKLTGQLEKYQSPKKTSGNSSIPPSKDENRPRTASLRERSGKKAGGQKGREGRTLKFSPSPDSVEEHVPSYCTGCGNNLEIFPRQFESKYQIIDIPPITAYTTEHRLYSKVCSCGCRTKGGAGLGSRPAVSYGSNAEALVAYLHSRQYIPFKRMQEILNTVFGFPISEGGIHCLLNRIARKFSAGYEAIRKQLSQTQEGFIGTDETGMRVNGAKHWAWTWQNNGATFISITSNRGMDSINGNFAAGFEKSVLVHDCWKSHFNTPAASHQICLAHLLRELNYLAEKYQNQWSGQCKTLLCDAIALKKRQLESTQDTSRESEILEKRLDRLLAASIAKEQKELVTFQKRLIKYRQFLFTFLYNKDVPFDNNSSERAIRNVKVKMKVSGMFRSVTGAHNFAVIRSVVDTMIKNRLPLLENMATIAGLHTD